VDIVPDSEPWKDGQDIASRGKYKYYPYNDVRQPAKESPTALNVVVVPDVTLPKVSKKRIFQRPCSAYYITRRLPRNCDGGSDSRLCQKLTSHRLYMIVIISGESRSSTLTRRTTQLHLRIGSKIPKLKVATY
jgi:hypothetical protein